MTQHDQSLLTTINKFMSMLNTLEDSKKSYGEFRNLLRLLIRLQNNKHTIPVVEVVSLIKAKKPNIFYLLRREAEIDTNLSIIISTTIAEEQAEQRVNSLIEKIR
ncbi:MULTISPECIES: hypothetical protein [Bacillaceae]|uniref:Uncharacterized protein n=1 Tax=Evansella alkalicola TaxID=745819 RepID=A0ABS6JVV2_9BACI|nr:MULTISPECIES: hypothetical protein [Bacillaceae]MBU9722726.1 hypothetical protein [Bacillus alkalicola]